MINQLWVLISSFLVLSLVFGISFLYGGLSRVNHSISSMLQPLIIIPVISIIWYFGAFNLIFSTNSSPYLGQFTPILSLFKSNAELSGLSLPLFSFFQLMFALVACSVILGATLERTSYKFNILFCCFWLIAVYCPVARWIWSHNGWLKQLGSVDFAGGLVVHISSGFTGLLLSNLVGRRLEYFKLRKKFNNALALIGLFLIWIGWFGFNGGSTYSFGLTAQMAVILTFLSSCASLISWLCIDLFHTPHKFSVTSYSLGVVSGLVAITPCAAYVSPTAAILIGLFAGVFCNYCARVMHKVFKVDDSTEVFSTHGFGGFLGAILTGVFAESSLLESGVKLDSILYANFISAIVVIVYSLIISLLIFKFLSLFCSPRVSDLLESEGLDLLDHGERVINS